jgi:DNA-binding NtrC family response regulator
MPSRKKPKLELVPPPLEIVPEPAPAEPPVPAPAPVPADAPIVPLEAAKLWKSAASQAQDDLLRQLLEEFGGNVKRTAEALGISRQHTTMIVKSQGLLEFAQEQRGKARAAR